MWLGEWGRSRHPTQDTLPGPRFQAREAPAQSRSPGLSPPGLLGARREERGPVRGGPWPCPAAPEAGTQEAPACSSSLPVRMSMKSESHFQSEALGHTDNIHSRRGEVHAVSAACGAPLTHGRVTARELFPKPRRWEPGSLGLVPGSPGTAGRAQGPYLPGPSLSSGRPRGRAPRWPLFGGCLCGHGGWDTGLRPQSCSRPRPRPRAGCLWHQEGAWVGRPVA